MRNIEIKARLRDIAAAERAAETLPGAAPHARMRQVDTYFNAPAGRLKLREIEPETGAARAEMVFYLRPDQAGPKRCDYELARVADPAAMQRLLTAAFGVRTVVDKFRIVFLYKNVRIHLDEVAGLGTFLEFEAVMPDDMPDTEGERLVGDLMAAFSIGAEDLLEDSYCDMIGGRD